MKILHLSDTHNCHHRLRDLPEADMVVHSGDFCMVGTEQEALDFLNWFCDLPYKHKIFICGNYDDCLYGANIDGLPDNVHQLSNSGIEIDGVKFYGVPMFLGDCITERQRHNYEKIPGDTDVLITHLRHTAYLIMMMVSTTDQKRYSRSYPNFTSKHIFSVISTPSMESWCKTASNSQMERL